MSKNFNIGFLSTSCIGEKNAKHIKLCEGVDVTVVGSRSLQKAQQYAKENKIQIAVGSYEEVINHELVDAVYIPLPTVYHLEWVKKCAMAGKHVLCEKPVALSSSELSEMLAVCKANNVVFMDGVMFQHNTRLTQMLNEIHKNTIGDVSLVNSVFSYPGTQMEGFENNIRMSASGDPLGCIGDLAWYNVRLALAFFDYEMPESLRANLHSKNNEGVPLHVSGELYFSKGRMSTFNVSFCHGEQQYAIISGSTGHLKIEDFCLPLDENLSKFIISKGSSGIIDPDLSDKKYEKEITNFESPGSQTTALWSDFRNLCLNRNEGVEEFYINLTRMNTTISDSILESISLDGKKVTVSKIGNQVSVTEKPQELLRESSPAIMARSAQD